MNFEAFCSPGVPIEMSHGYLHEFGISLQIASKPPLHPIAISNMTTKKIEQDKLVPSPRFPDIIIALDLLDPSPSAPKFHWLLFVQDPDSKQGNKFHATNSRGYWEFEHVKFSLIDSASVAVAAVVGTVGDHDIARFAAALGAIPMELPAADEGKEPRFTCRVWVREALRRLHANGYIDCPDVDAIEREMMEYAKPAISSINDESFVLATLHSAVNSR